MKKEREINQRQDTEESSGMENIKEKYHVTDKQIREAIYAVGKDRKKVEEYLKETFGKYKDGNKPINPEDIA